MIQQFDPPDYDRPSVADQDPLTIKTDILKLTGNVSNLLKS
jgi:hypothetical protein